MGPSGKRKMILRMSRGSPKNLIPESTKACDHSSATREALDHLKGGGWLHSAELAHAGTENVPFYAYVRDPRRDSVVPLVEEFRMTDGRLFSRLLRGLQLQLALVLFEKRPQSLRNIQ
jgi:hypothetical protein